MSITYANIKAAMQEDGMPTASGSAWQGQDQGTFNNQFVPQAAFLAGVHVNPRDANYGIAYPGVMPAAIAAAITEGSYSATLAASPLTGTHASTVITLTLTETGGAGTSFLWAFGDGTTATTTTNTTTHTYAAAGSFTASVQPTVNGIQLAAINAAAPVVIS